MTVSGPRVSIVLSDRNWILERLGKELQSRLEGIDLNDAADPSADINYYITFACRKAPAPTLEMGWFAHMEQAPHLQELFYQTAREIDLPVTHSKLYRDLLHEAGSKHAIAIPPGVDLNRFVPKLRIGVVGRAYHTGRKGEGLVSQLMDMEGVDWHFTGTGWPKPGKFIPEDALPDFYRSMDFILVPALYEGGPMCVPEALAVGTPVIASDVGWVPEFPHIPFRNGDAEDLRRVLTEQLDVKKKLHASTESFTWDNYAEAHDRAFRELMVSADKAPKSRRPPPVRPPFSESVRLLLHGNEATTLGGPSVRVPRTAEALRSLGVPAQAGVFTPAAEIPEGIVHLFNVWNPHTGSAAMRHLKEAGKKIVFSPIYLDLSERDFWQNDLPDLIMQDDPGFLAQRYAEARAHQAGRGRLAEAMPGYHARVREMLQLADHVVFLSQVERAALEKIGAVVEDERASLVHNPVDTTLWQEADPGLFRETYREQGLGDADYIVCIGRLETRKNQLMLARAVRGLPVKLVLIGHEGDPSYAAKVREIGGDQILMTGRLDHGGDLLRSALAGAGAFVLPSWAEGASLAALEAAAVGANLVLSDRSSEREYFGDLAQYCDPGDLESLRAAIMAALAIEDRQARAEKLRALVREKNSWEHYARETAEAYARCMASTSKSVPDISRAIPRHAPKLVFDVTTLAHHQGRVTGISRVENMLSQAFQDAGADPMFICWNDSIRRFVEVPEKFARMRHAFRYRSQWDKRRDTPAVDLPEDCTIVVPGSAWMQNGRYVRGLETLKTRSGCSLISVIHDLIPFKFPFWFEKAYSPVFEDNFYRLAAISDRILTNSDCTGADVRQVLMAAGHPVPPVDSIRFGDPVLTTSQTDDEDMPPSPVEERLADKKFVLAVGAIHTRKNYDMLYRVWARFADEGKHRDLHLVIVGGAAWNGKPLADRIAGDRRVNRNIHILSGIEDEDLGWLYENCLFTAFPSHYEGWGLPVAESLVHGKLPLATSASSVPEIAPDFVEHIDPEDFTTWHSKISFFASSASARQAKEDAIQAGYTPVPWTRTASLLLEAVKEPRVVRGLEGLLAADIAQAGNGGAPLKIGFGAGWHPVESWGRWTSAPRASFSVNAARVLRPGQDHLHLLLKLDFYRADDAPYTFALRAGGQTLFSSRVSRRSKLKDVILTVPCEAVASDGLLTVDVIHPVSPEKAQGGISERSLGLGLVSVSLLDAEHSNPLQYLQKSQNWSDGQSATQVDLSRRDHRSIVAPHLSFHPAWGMGSDMGQFDLLVPIVPGVCDQDLSMTIRPVATPNAPVTSKIMWNGQEIRRDTWTNDAFETMNVCLPATLLARSGPSVLSVETDSLLTARDLDLGVSEDIGGLGLIALSLTPKEA